MTVPIKPLSLLDNKGKPAMGDNMKTKLLIGAAMAAMWAVPAAADVPIYAYGGLPNYCPSGLQPVVVGGDISCGTPNRGMTYQQVKVHPVQRAKKRHMRRVAGSYCPEGMKGCVSR